jgi:hypothetical protein
MARKTLIRSSIAVLVVGLVSIRGAEAAPPPQKAIGSVELNAPATPLKPMTLCCPQKSVPALDVISLSIRSDGTRLTFATTLAAVPGITPGSPVTVYIDSDNNASTGVKADSLRGIPGGVEYKAELTLCMTYSDRSASCAGGSATSTTATERHGAMTLEHFKGESTTDTETVVDRMGFPGRKPSVTVPVSGKVVEASIEYADLKTRPGQTIRLYPRKTGGGGGEEPEFPSVLLTLK